MSLSLSLSLFTRHPCTPTHAPHHTARAWGCRRKGRGGSIRLAAAAPCLSPNAAAAVPLDRPSITVVVPPPTMQMSQAQCIGAHMIMSNNPRLLCMWAGFSCVHTPKCRRTDVCSSIDSLIASTLTGASPAPCRNITSSRLRVLTEFCTDTNV